MKLSHAGTVLALLSTINAQTFSDCNPLSQCMYLDPMRRSQY